MRLIGFIITMSVMSLTAFAQEHRELGAHMHGVGEINLAIAENQMLIGLEASGVDIVGFEHPATSAADQQLIASALAKLESGDALFTLPDNAECELVSATAELHGDDEDGDHAHDDHEHDDDEHEHESDVTGTHTTFEAQYRFECAAPENLTTVTFSYIDQFAASSELHVQAVGPSGVALFTATAETPTIDLSDLI